jgi:membrane-associated protease RseP (regulator of RpoE activity)
MDLYVLSILIFIMVLAILIWRDRRNIEWKYGILLIRRTKKFGRLIDSTAKSAPKVWKVLSTAAIAICLGLMAYGMFFIATMKAPLYIVLPTPAPVGAVAGPGIFIPFWTWIIAIATILIPHEFLHGVIARVERIRLRSVGLLLLAIFPGAFVEPDERKLRAAPLLTQWRIFAAGSFANFVVAMAILGLLSLVIWPALAAPGIQLLDVNATAPAGLAGLKPGMIISEIDGKPLMTTYREHLAGNYLLEELPDPKPGQTIKLLADDKLYNVTLAVHPQTNVAYMGIVYSPVFRVQPDFMLTFLIPLLTIVWLFSLGVGVFNILPIYPLDGGQMIRALLDKIAKRWSSYIVSGLTLLTVSIILYSFVRAP